MRFIAKEITREPSLDVIAELAQAGDDVNIRLNRCMVAWFDANDKKLCVNVPTLKGLGITVTLTR